MRRPEHQRVGRPPEDPETDAIQARPGKQDPRPGSGPSIALPSKFHRQVAEAVRQPCEARDIRINAPLNEADIYKLIVTPNFMLKYLRCDRNGFLG